MQIWKKTLASAVIVALAAGTPSVLTVIPAAHAAVLDAQVPNVLSGALQVKVKSISTEKITGGTRLAAVVTMYNVWESTARVPDYELRARTASGTEYVLRPSADQPVSIAPMSSVELRYMIVVDRQDAPAPTELVWVDVNKDVYPKQETKLLELPVASLVWSGAASSAGQLSQIEWGKSFTIPGLDSSLSYQPVSLTKQFKDGAAAQVLQLLVTNGGASAEAIPAVEFDGQAAGQLYAGALLDANAGALEPQERRYVYFAIPYDLTQPLENLTVMTKESYRVPGKTDASATVNYTVGKLRLAVPSQDGSAASVPLTEGLHRALKLDPLAKSAYSELGASVEDFRLYENKGQGYQSGVVKLKLSNGTDKPLPVPAWAFDLIGPDGNSYTGSRVSGNLTEVLPGTANVVDYAFVVPLAAKPGNHFTLQLNDAKTAAPYKAPIAQVSLEAGYPYQLSQSTEFYPYKLDIKSHSISLSTSGSPAGGYTYQFKLKWDVELSSTETVISDDSASKLQLELLGADERKLGTQTLNLVGDNKMLNGEQNIYFRDPVDQLENNLKINVYEVFETPHGQARMLIAHLE